MATFDLPSWLQPKEAPWHALVAGAQVGSQIAANRARNQALYAEIQQNQQRQDLSERKFMADNEAQTLKNDAMRAKLSNDSEDFATLRSWWPQFSSNADVEVPVLHNPDTAMRLSGLVTEKRRKQSLVDVARAMQGNDLGTPEGQAAYLEAWTPDAVAKAGGIESIYKPIEVAEKLKVSRDAALARVAVQRESTLARMTFLYDQLAKTDATKTEANRIAALRADTQALLADSTIGLNDERVIKAIAETEAIGARTSIAQGNLEQRRAENKLARERLEAKLPEADKIKLNHELNVLREQLDNYELTPAEYYQKRDEVYQKYTPKVAPADGGWKIEPVK